MGSEPATRESVHNSIYPAYAAPIGAGGETAQSRLAAARDMRAGMRGRVVLAGDDTYSHVRQIWNGAVDHQSALFALCETVKEVQTAVRTARARWK